MANDGSAQLVRGTLNLRTFSGWPGLESAEAPEWRAIVVQPRENCESKVQGKPFRGVRRASCPSHPKSSQARSVAATLPDFLATPGTTDEPATAGRVQDNGRHQWRGVVKKQPRILWGRGVGKAGDDLLSRGCTIIGATGLTAEFGMGSGVALSLWSPAKVGFAVGRSRPSIVGFAVGRSRR